MAVSGGGDSMALLLLLADCARERGVRLEAATVDHGLRAEAAEEAAFVAATCRDLGITHEILRWESWGEQGNLQAEARRARYRLLGDWAQRRGITTLAVAHTRDDQAETFLMRLGRRSGVDGLAAMGEVVSLPGAQGGDPDLWRPLLAIGRGELRDYLRARGQGWCEDPSNEDLRYDRVKARGALAGLADLGIDAEALAVVADNIADARAALDHASAGYLRDLARVEAGDVIFAVGFDYLPYVFRRRVLARALNFVAPSDYGSRRAEIEAALSGGAGARTLQGCLLTRLNDGSLRIAREYAAVKALCGPPDALWDRRWQLSGPDHDVEIRALGEAVKNCPDWRETGIPRASLMATPAVWRGTEMIAAPLAGWANGWSAKLALPDGDFFSELLSH
ncbi:MAG: tRNA lysidine(34) synthetase TilS [Maritimibacter sp.]